MTTEISPGRPKKSSIMAILFKKVIPVILLIWMAVYTIAMAISVQKQVKVLHSKTGTAADTASLSKEEWQLLKDKTFLQARIALAGDDSIAMTLDFRDSLIRLETKGVVLRQIQYNDVEVTRFFRGLNPIAYTALFSSPFTITEIEGSIVKEPIQVKKAPRDSTEAAQNVAKVDTGKVEFVEWHLQLDSTFVISFVQSERSFGKIDWPTMKYRFRRHYKTLMETNRDLIRFRIPVYHPEVTLFIPANEAKSFYRALPPHGKVALKF